VTDRDALYAAVLAAPDDDTPRLVYADYLDDTGVRADGIRARFIRNQVALARAEPWSDEHDRLYRATHPVEYHYGDWWSQLAPEAIPEVRYARGFVEEVTGLPGWFLAYGPGLFEAHPIRSVVLGNAPGAGVRPLEASLVASPFLSRLRGVAVPVPLRGDALLAGLSASPHVSGLRRLRVRWHPHDDSPLPDTGALFPPALAELDLSRNPAVGDRLVGAVAAHPSLVRLEELDLAETMVGLEGLTALAASADATGLRRLRVGCWQRISDGFAVVLARSPHLRGLVELDLKRVSLEGGTAEAFAEAYAWPGLRRLGLQRTRFPREAIPALARNPLSRSLAAVDFRNTSISSADLGELREACPDTRFLTDDTDRPVPFSLAPEDRL
jgi:uncharacterized protein (TIGR02996 family)